jgi:hypothetical protein
VTPVQLTIPVEFRCGLALTGVSSPAMQVGDALMLAPYDKDLAAVTGRLEALMEAAASDVDDLIEAAADARGEIVREEFGCREER